MRTLKSSQKKIAWPFFANLPNKPELMDQGRQHESVFMTSPVLRQRWVCRGEGKRKLNLQLSPWWNTGKQKWREWLHFLSWPYPVKVIKITLCFHQAPEFLEPRLECSSLLQLTMAGSPQRGEHFGSSGISSQIQYVLQVQNKTKKQHLFPHL